MVKKDHRKELSQLEQYINNNDNEDAKRPLLYPIFSKVFGSKMKIAWTVIGENKYSRRQYLRNLELQNESYFKNIDCDDFLTPNNGLIQIRKFAEKHAEVELLNQFALFAKHVNVSRYELLVGEFGYFK